MKKKYIDFSTILGTLPTIILLAFYCLITISITNEFDFISTLIVFILGIYMYKFYYQNGEKFGQYDERFLNNRQVYNQKATELNNNLLFENLRKYCDFEYQQRKKDYEIFIANSLNITLAELEFLKLKPTAELKKLEDFEINGKHFYFDKHKRKILLNYLNKPCPVKKNEANTIMNAQENNIVNNIKDMSIIKDKQDFVIKIIINSFIAFVCGIVLLIPKDNLTIAEIVMFLTYLTNTISNGVAGYVNGKNNITKNKTQFYIELINFIDHFNEWNKKQKAE